MTPPRTTPASGVRGLALPPVGTVVSATFGPAHVRDCRTRVEAVVGTRVVVVAPTRPGGIPILPGPGTEIGLRWTSPAGVHLATGHLEGVEHDVVACWVVTVVRCERQQRRTAFRLDASLPITLRYDTAVVAGRTHDLSETGVRCVVPADRSAEVAGEGAVEAAIVLPGGLPVVTSARTVEVVARPHRPGGPREVWVRLAFVGDDVSRDTLRRFVITEQLARGGTGVRGRPVRGRGRGPG